MEFSGKTLLHVAAEKGDLTYVQDLVKCQENLNIKDNIMYTPLHYAARHGYADIVEYLLKSGANVDEREFDNKTALHLASCFGNRNCVEVLLAHGADATLTDIEDMTSLHYAAAAAHSDIITLLIEQGKADVDAGIVDYCTPLYMAVLGSMLQSMAFIPEHKKTLLAECLKILKDDKLTFQTFLDGFGLELPQSHLRLDYGSCIYALLENGANANVLDADYDDCPLLMAVATNNSKLIENLATFGADVNTKVCHNVTLLYIAARLGFASCVEALLQFGADLHLSDLNGATPLHMAAEGGHVDVINLLIKHGANVNQPTRNGMTPLHVLVRRASEENLHISLDSNPYLFDQGDVKKTRSTSSLPTDGDYVRCVKLLLQHGAKVNATNLRAQTPLMYAISNHDCPELVQALLSSNADINAKDVTGSTSLDIAFRKDYRASLRVLRRNGAKHGDDYYKHASALNLPIASLHNLITASEHRLPKMATSERSVVKKSTNDKSASTSKL